MENLTAEVLEIVEELVSLDERLMYLAADAEIEQREYREGKRNLADLGAPPEAFYAARAHVQAALSELERYS